MANIRIAVVVGSLRRESLNRKFALAVARMAPSDFAFELAKIDDLPLYNQDDDDAPAPAVKRFKQEILAAQAVLIITPEYNRSIPGVLKNAIDHASRPYGQSVWANKPAGIVGVSIGAIGTAVAQQHLRGILAYLDMPTMGQPEAYIQAKDALFDGAGNIGPESNKFVQDWMNRYVAFVRASVLVRSRTDAS